MAVGIWSPGTQMFMRRVAYDTRFPRVWVEGVSCDGDGVWNQRAESGSSHV